MAIFTGSEQRRVARGVDSVERGWAGVDQQGCHGEMASNTRQHEGSGALAISSISSSTRCEEGLCALAGAASCRCMQWRLLCKLLNRIDLVLSGCDRCSQLVEISSCGCVMQR